MSDSSKEGLQWPSWLEQGIGEALAHLETPAYVLDRRGRIRWENALALDVFGDHLGSPFTVLIAPEYIPLARLEFTKKVIGSARTSNYKSVLRTRAGRHVGVEIRAVAVRNGEHVVGVFGVVEVAADTFARHVPIGQLTPRQHEVLRVLARGHSTAQIAESLGVTRHTVRNHVRGLTRALGVHSRLAAIAEGRRRGLID